VIAVVTQVAPALGVAPACAAVGLPRATYYRHRAGSHQPSPVPPRARAKPKQALPPAQRQEVLDVLHEDRFLDLPPAEVWAQMLDEGRHLCSIRTMYRLLAENAEVRERRRQRVHPPYEKPVLVATAPNEVWSWDITKLLGPQKWTYFYLYVLLDIFSRYVVGWLVAERESAALARRLVAETCAREQIQPGQLAVHQDRGAPMTAKTFTQTLAGLGVNKSYSRPRTSNDNPYSEAHFKTVKYHLDFPLRFDDLRHAEMYLRDFFRWYNQEHHHVALGLMTPHDVHHGLAAEKWRHRADVLAAAYAAHPERFPRGRPAPPPLPTAAWINKPTSTTIDLQPAQ
jgi:putative transposase